MKVKGTDKNMKCKDFQYEFGKIYFINKDGNVESTDEGSTLLLSNLPEPKLCSKGGLHYCDTLEQVFSHYASGRYFEIEVLGKEVGDDSKKATNAFKFIKEISAEDVEKERLSIKERKIEAKLSLEIIRKLQEEFPNLILGGSISLYLHGIRLKRFNSWCGDFDFILPFWQDLTEVDKIDITEEEDFFDEDGDEDYGDNEEFQFNSRFYINGIKTDVKINPKQRYETVEHKGFKYKVVPVLTIIEAKMQYAKSRKGGKHKDDILEMLGLKK